MIFFFLSLFRLCKTVSLYIVTKFIRIYTSSSVFSSIENASVISSIILYCSDDFCVCHFQLFIMFLSVLPKISERV